MCLTDAVNVIKRRWGCCENDFFWILNLLEKENLKFNRAFLYQTMSLLAYHPEVDYNLCMDKLWKIAEKDRPKNLKHECLQLIDAIGENKTFPTYIGQMEYYEKRTGIY